MLVYQRVILYKVSPPPVVFEICVLFSKPINYSYIMLYLHKPNAVKQVKREQNLECASRSGNKHHIVEKCIPMRSH